MPSPSITPSITPSLTPSLPISGSLPTVADLCMNIEFGPAPSVTPSISPSRTPSATPSATPSITPSTTPSISITPSVTPSSTNPPPSPSVTPSLTPSNTITPSITPSISPSKTPSITPSLTPSNTVTPSITPSPSSPTECPVYYLNYSIINNVGAYRSYYYSLLTNTSTLVTISTYPQQGSPITDLTFSNDKFWYLTNSTTGNPNNPSTYAVRAIVIEFNKVNPTNMSYNRTLTINLPSGSSSSGYSGFCVLNSNTLLSVRTLGVSLYSPIIIALNITGNGTSTDVFTPIQGRYIQGMLYTTTGKLIVISQTPTGQNYITQYSYPSGIVEFDLVIQSGRGTIFENNGSVYFTLSNSLYKINNNTPYSVTYVNDIGRDVQGSSGINSCNNVNFVPNVTGICDNILYKTQGNQYYSYNFPSNTSTLLSVPTPPSEEVSPTNPPRGVIANTSDKLWSYTFNTNSSNLSNNSIVEYNTTSSPFTATINRYIALPKILNNDITAGTGLFAINNTKLIGTINNIGSQDLSSVFTESEFNNSNYPLRKYANGIMVVEYDITSNVATWTLKVKLLPYEKVTGGLLLTLDNKLIILTKATNEPKYYISQYNYTTGVLEFRSIISPTIATDCGLVEINNEIYIMGYNTYKFNRTTYELESTQSPQTQLIASSQLAGCVNVNLPTSSCPECVGLPLKLSTSVVYGGVTISPTYTGPLYGSSNNVGAIDTLYPSYYTSCTGSSVLTHPSFSAWLGAGEAQSPYTYSLNFSQPVNDIKLIYNGTNNNETFIWDTNGGTPNLTLCKSCYQTINGNIVSGNWDNAIPNNPIGGGGVLTISAPLNYTTLTLRSPGGNKGTIFGICSGSIIPQPTNTLGCVYYSTINSSNQPTTYLYNANNNTSVQVTLPTDTFNSFAETHTSTKYWKGNQTSTIKEWIPTSTPNVLALNRTINVSGITSPFGNYFALLASVNDTTLLTTTIPVINTCALVSMNITDTNVTAGDLTTLFTFTDQFVDSMLLTSNNKIITIGRTNNSAYLTQYSYPTGIQEVRTDITSLGFTQGVTQWYLFESNGNLYFSKQNPRPTSIIYQVNLNTYAITTVYSSLGLFGATFNSSTECNTATLNVIPPPQPSPSPTPSPTPSLTPPVSPNVGVNTIYKYLDIL